MMFRQGDIIIQGVHVTLLDVTSVDVASLFVDAHVIVMSVGCKSSVEA